MSVSSEVDIGLLTDCFNLKPFNGLRRLLDDYESSEDKDEKEDVEETEEEGLCLKGSHSFSWRRHNCFTSNHAGKLIHLLRHLSQ